MKILRSVLVGVVLSVSWVWAAAQDFAEVVQPDSGMMAQRALLSPGEIENIVAPIALYPDPLIALILPASTRPSDIVLAARFLDRGGHPDGAAGELWDDSVKALTRYREVLIYLDTNLEWTRRLGECFLDQPDDVMGAVQAVRARARSAGLLSNTPQQEVIFEDEEIRIVPAQPTVIYVPRYDPQIIYYSAGPSYYSGAFLSFGIGYSIGSWLNYDCDWRYGHVRIVQRPSSWYYQPDWRRRHAHQPQAWTRWTPRHDRHDRYDRRDRNHYSDRRRDGFNRTGSTERRWNSSGGIELNNASGATTWNSTAPQVTRDRSRNWERPQQAQRFENAGDRIRSARPDFQNRQRRENFAPGAGGPVLSAPEAVAIAPTVPTAPTAVTQTPAPAPTSNQRWTNRGDFPRRDEDQRAHRPRGNDRQRGDDQPRTDRPRREHYRPAPAPVQSAAILPAPAAVQGPATPTPRFTPPPRSQDAPRSNDAPARPRAERRDHPRRADRADDDRRELR